MLASQTLTWALAYLSQHPLLAVKFCCPRWLCFLPWSSSKVIQGRVSVGEKGGREGWCPSGGHSPDPGSPGSSALAWGREPRSQRADRTHCGVCTWPRKAPALFFFRTRTCFSFLCLPCVDDPGIDRRRKRKCDCSGLRKVKTGRWGADNIMVNNNTLQSIVLGFTEQWHTPALISSWRGIHNRQCQCGYLCNYRLATAGLWWMLWCATQGPLRTEALTPSAVGSVGCWCHHCVPHWGLPSTEGICPTQALPPSLGHPSSRTPLGSTENSSNCFRVQQMGFYSLYCF